MKRKFAAILLILSSQWLTGCQAAIYGTAADLEKLQLGMPKERVVEVMGNPTATEADGDKDEEYLSYKRMKHAISAWPKMYTITLRHNKVVRWTEDSREPSSK